MPTKSLKTKPYYQWLICAASTMLMFCVIGLTVSAFAIYLPYIRQANGFNNTQTNALVTCRAISQLIGIMLIGKYYKKLGIRVGAALAAAALGVGFILYGFANHYAVYCAAAIVCGFGCGLGSSAGSLIINEWFDKNRGLALGISSAGTGVAAIVGPVILTVIIENVSMRASFIIEGLFILVIAVIVFAIFCEKPGKQQPTAAPAEALSGEKKKLTKFEIPFKYVACLTIGLFLAGVAVNGIMGGLAQLLREHYDGTTTSFYVTVLGVALLAGKMIYGRLVDTIGMRTTNYIAFACLMVGSAGICFLSHSPVGLIISIIIAGLGCPLGTVVTSLVTGDYCRPERFVDAMKQFSFALAFGGLVVSYVTGFLADATGSNQTLFGLLAVLTVVAAVLFQLVYHVCTPKSAKK